MPWANIVTAAATLIAAYIGANLAQRNQAREFDRQAREKHRLEQRDVILALVSAAVAAQAENERLIALAEAKASIHGIYTDAPPSELDPLREQIQVAGARMDTLREEFRRARLIITDPELRSQVDDFGAIMAVYARYVSMVPQSIAEPEKLAGSKTAAEAQRKDTVVLIQLLSENAAERLSPAYKPPTDPLRERVKGRWRRVIRRTPTPPAGGLPLA